MGNPPTENEIVEKVAAAIQRAWTPETMEAPDPPLILARAALAALSDTDGDGA